MQGHPDSPVLPKAMPVDAIPVDATIATAARRAGFDTPLPETV